MKYKAGNKVRQTIDCSGTLAGRIYTVKYGNVRGDYKDWLYIWDTSTSIWEGGCNCKHKWEPVTNRSKVGKKAYQTFLKNGGSRNSKGQFSKKQFESKWFSYLDRAVSDVMLNGTTIKIRKPEKKQKIDWKKVGKDIYEAYNRTPFFLFDNAHEHAKAYAKVFQKHGLIKEGVEI